MGKGQEFSFYGVGITDQRKNKAGKELGTSQTRVQLPSIASLATLRTGQPYNPKTCREQAQLSLKLPEQGGRKVGVRA